MKQVFSLLKVITICFFISGCAMYHGRPYYVREQPFTAGQAGTLLPGEILAEKSNLVYLPYYIAIQDVDVPHQRLFGWSPIKKGMRFFIQEHKDERLLLYSPEFSKNSVISYIEVKEDGTLYSDKPVITDLTLAKGKPTQSSWDLEDMRVFTRETDFGSYKKSLRFEGSDGKFAIFTYSDDHDPGSEGVFHERLKFEISGPSTVDIDFVQFRVLAWESGRLHYEITGDKDYAGGRSYPEKSIVQFPVLRPEVGADLTAAAITADDQPDAVFAIIKTYLREGYIGAYYDSADAYSRGQLDAFTAGIIYRLRQTTNGVPEEFRGLEERDLFTAMARRGLISRDGSADLEVREESRIKDYKIEGDKATLEIQTGDTTKSLEMFREGEIWKLRITQSLK